MAIMKCKMCGGNLEFEWGESVGVCESCGTKQTLPKIDDEVRANLYNRANHLRQKNEFDKAEQIYEQILAEEPFEAEAYWSLVLCRYGIEYVEDTRSGKRVPTINRTQYTSVYDDANYKSAIEYADEGQRIIYEEEAHSINEIQKKYLALSESEEPFDVFISYKEKDDMTHQRTHDSVLANDLYHQLTQEGYKVFYSRVTLEDKLGSEYEPYIFAALNSAKVMVVIGTRPEYFNAVWVKNEWSRFLSMVKSSNGEKALIPAYKDMDPYDLPEEFSHLQAQDMSKIGFIQDLIRGIKKIVDYKKTKKSRDLPPDFGESFGFTGEVSHEKLLQNAETFITLGNYAEAIKIYEKITLNYPEDYRGWWGRITCLTHSFTKEDKIMECREWYNYVCQLAPKDVLPDLRKKYDALYFQKRRRDLTIEGEELLKTINKAKKDSVDEKRAVLAEIAASQEHIAEKRDNRDSIVKELEENITRHSAYVERGHKYKKIMAVVLKVTGLLAVICFLGGLVIGISFSIQLTFAAIGVGALIAVVFYNGVVEGKDSEERVKEFKEKLCAEKSDFEAFFAEETKKNDLRNESAQTIDKRVKDLTSASLLSAEVLGFIIKGTDEEIESNKSISRTLIPRVREIRDLYDEVAKME